MLRYLPGILFITSFLFTSLFIAGCRPDYSDSIDTVAVHIRNVVDDIEVSHQYYKSKVESKTEAFYEANKMNKQWLGDKQPSPRFNAFVAEVKESFRYGMNPDDYDIVSLEKAVESLYKNRKRTEAEISKLDIRITASFFLFTTHLLEGRIRNPGARDYIWKRGMPHEDDVALLLENDSRKELRDELDELQPRHPQYKKLQEALKTYRDLEAKHSFEAIPKRINLKPGDSDPAIPVIKRRLMLTDMKSSARLGRDSIIYDSALFDAVKRFQKRHGLKEDGIVDTELARYLNMPFRDLADLIALNLERLRWQPHLPTNREYIIVNVPEYMLRVYKHERQIMQMRVVLGSEFNATPIFADTLKYVVFSPTWNVPKSILEEEFLTKLKDRPSYYGDQFKFYRKGKEIDPEEEDWEKAKKKIEEYQAVQRPGSANSLGYIKFVMPNNYNIYLHDTPAERLFNAQDRAFSHGCIRLEKPLELAEYLLEDQKTKWNRKAMLAAMQLEEPKQVNLKKEYPVHITYHTAWVDDDGLVNFRKDVYGHDERQLAQLVKNKPLLGYRSDE